MPGIFSSCIVSKRTGFSYCGSPVKSDVRRTLRLDSSISSNKYSTGTSRTESSHSSVDDVDRTLRCIHLDDRLACQASDNIINDISSISGTTTSIHPPALSKRFYCNKEHNAMLFSETSEDDGSNKTYGRTRQQRQRQYEPSPSPCPCEWGYFVDTD